ncbi:MAG: dihydrofolate reductase family protein, partial [Sphingomonadaceae bacterium]|nr:dihydrofolate reductase family protein [Sphingomonadaceae bacterium]
MRRVVAAGFVSLDGVMQAPGGPEEDPTGGFRHGGWSFPYWDQAMGEWMGEGFAQPFDLLLGRRTYEIFAAHWPFTEEEPAALFNGVTKYVATSATAPLAWENSERLEGDVPAAVAQLKQSEGPDLLTQGSSVLVQSLLEAGLVDEIRLLIFPVLL